MTFELGQGLPGRAWATKEPVWVADVKSDRALPRAPFAREAGIGAAMAIPVLASEEVVAVLEFFGSEKRERDDAAVDMVSTAASQLGTVIERKRAEEALRTSEERFRLVVDGVEDYAIIVLDPSGNVASWNHGAARIMGYDAHEIIGYHLARFYSPESVEEGEPERNLASAVADGRYEQSEWLVRRDGLRFWADVVITPLGNGDRERLRGFGCVVRDNTERRRIEQDSQHLGALIEHSEDAIIGTTAERNIVTSWNPGAERLFGYTAREMVGRSMAVLVPPDERDAHLAVLARVLEGTHADHYDTEAVRKNGSNVDLSVTVSPIKDPDGAVNGVSWIARDVTDRRRAQEYVEKAFGAYLDPEVADHILSQGPALAGQDVDVTMVFVDIRDFTAFSERCEPREVVEALNCLFERVVPIISERGGHVDKFVGDGLLAVFGAPQRLPDHADRALEAALEIDRAVLKHFHGDLEIAIGIASGTVVAGNVGGGGRLDFTVIGDAVNMASRVEAATRRTGDTILITDSTRRLLTAPVLLEERPDVPIKGKGKLIALYAPSPQGDGA
jgi:PAS domain S-box-containing protein